MSEIDPHHRYDALMGFTEHDIHGTHVRTLGGRFVRTIDTTYPDEPTFPDLYHFRLFGRIFVRVPWLLWAMFRHG